MALSSVLGFPRIGEKREWKKAIEAYWNHQLTEQELHDSLQHIRLHNLQLQQARGIDLIPVNDFTYYDQVLDTAVMFGFIPKRFSYEGGKVPLSVYYGMARGTDQAEACEMTKWFNTNYHYIVPELNGCLPKLTENKPLSAFIEAKERLGITGKPVILGPLSFLKLSKGYAPEELDSWIDQLLPLYVQVLQELGAASAQWVQIDEPILVTEVTKEDLTRLTLIYETFAKQAPGLKIMLQTYFEAVEAYPEICKLPVQGIGLDFVHGRANLDAIHQHGFPEDKHLGVGIIDGRGIWRANLQEKQQLIDQLTKHVSADRLIIQSSCSLIHVPVSLTNETRLPEALKQTLAFAYEKLEEITSLTASVNGRTDEFHRLAEESLHAYEQLHRSVEQNRNDIHQTVQSLKEQPADRMSEFKKRNQIQQDKWKLPILPTTTIGSLPQSSEVRKARQSWRKGQWSDEQYKQFIQQQMDQWIEIQEELDLDVLVHGEFERTDMVEYFGEKLDGFAFMQNGWVQSYGSRCVKPPIIYGDVAFKGKMTVDEVVYAQSRTKRPVKGMLTGPITILNWSFVREDISREDVAYQLAYALRQEVEALEQAGIGIIQVDEPAVREGLPLKTADQAHYLNWAVKTFRITTCTVQDETQIHTHMCYCEFHEMIDIITAMDADVISIETSRSHGELIASFEEHTYDHGIGLGVYDIHSPRVPRVEEISTMIDRALRVLKPQLFWINPDCGLKTRNKKETIDSLRNMVSATKEARVKYRPSATIKK